MAIWRIHLNAAGDEPDRFCIDRHFLGVGWQVEGGYSGMDWNTYYDLGMEQYFNQGDDGWWRALNAIHNRMERNDLCWTRDQNGDYYLGKILGNWQFLNWSKNQEADIVNVRHCEWKHVGGIDHVPGKVQNSFRARATIQKINDNSARSYSNYFYDGIVAVDDQNRNLFSLVSPEDCEDFVGIYLQRELGYTLIPSTCKNDTQKTEFVLKNHEGEEAYVQVKQETLINRDHFALEPNSPRKWFLFSTNNQYCGEKSDHKICLCPRVIEEFVRANRNHMSGRVCNWLDYIDQIILAQGAIQH